MGGAFGDVGSWSFENSKHLTTGDGGIIACDDEELGDRIRKLNCQGFRNATAESGKIRVSKDLFQNPSYKRHSMYGFMYRLPEVAAAIGLGQLEKLDWFVALRKKMAVKYLNVIKELKCTWLEPQEVPEGDVNSYYTFAAKYVRSDVPWAEFRRKYVEYGGDGIYAAWALCYLEDSIPDVRSMLEKMHLGDRLSVEQGLCPKAETVQAQLMQFTTNQKDAAEMEKQAGCLYKTILYFS